MACACAVVYLDFESNVERFEEEVASTWTTAHIRLQLLQTWPLRSRSWRYRQFVQTTFPTYSVLQCPPPTTVLAYAQWTAKRVEREFYIL